MTRPGTNGEFSIKYTNLAATYNGIDDITVKCNYWLNPIVPKDYTDYVVITTKDFNENIIDRSPGIPLLASTFSAYQVPDAEVDYAISNGVVQTATDYTIKISNVPLETNGCYIKFNFP